MAKVVDSKQGPGPKHMKEITKRARRREARLQQQRLRQSTPKATTGGGGGGGGSRGASGHGCNGSNGDGGSGGGNDIQSSLPQVVSRTLFHHHKRHPHHSSTCVACWADQNSCAGGGGAGSTTPAARTRSAVARNLQLTGNVFGETHNTGGSWTPTCSGSQMIPSGAFLSHRSHHHHSSQEFRLPPPPPPSFLHSGDGGAGGSFVVRGKGVMTRAASSAFRALAPHGSRGGCFDGASSTASSTTSTPSTPTRTANRRTRLPPVKISSDRVEVHDILQKIQKDNQALNLDSRQINMAMQREIRLRNRTVNSPQIMARVSGAINGSSRIPLVSSNGGNVIGVDVRSAIANGSAQYVTNSTER